MPRTGKCTNYASCLLACRMENISVAEDAPFICPECKQPLIKGGGKPMAIPALILGGISLLVLMGAGAVYYQVRNYRSQQPPAGQIGSSFEQAEVAAAHHELMPSRHMAASPSPSPTGGF